MSLSCDVFSYGMLLYEIFVWKLPFADTKTDPEVITKIVNDEVKSAYIACLHNMDAKTEEITTVDADKL